MCAIRIGKEFIRGNPKALLAIDVLINNAGVAHALTPVEELPIETWKEVDRDQSYWNFSGYTRGVAADAVWKQHRK